MIYERSKPGGVSRYAVRVYRGDGTYEHVGTFPTREEAEVAERAAKPPKRNCRKCGRRFAPSDDRRVTCDQCVEKQAQSEPSIDDHWLYRCYDADLNLLYVGITSAGTKRFRRHGNDKSWWREVDTIKLDHFDTREEVEAAEVKAIWDLKPRHNRDYRRPDGNVIRMRDWRKRRPA